jgi:hypothetical protein
LEVQSIDDECAFGLLNLLVSGKDLVANPIALPAPVPSGLLDGGEAPEEGSECDILYNEERQPNQFFLLYLSGRVGRRDGLRFRLELGAGSPASILGAPVFKGGLLIGIVESALPSASDPSAFGSDVDTRSSVQVLSVAAMADSKVTPAVRNLLPRVGGDPKPSASFPTGGTIRQIDGLRTEISAPSEAKPAETDSLVGGADAARSATLKLAPDAAGESAAVDLSDAAMFARLSVSSRRALGRAAGMRRSVGRGAIHMEHLIAGLFDEGWQPFFGQAGIGENDLRAIIMRTVGTEIPRDYSPVELGKLPAMSTHVRQALAAANRLYVPSLAVQVRSGQLLSGALSVEDCRMVQALIESGVHKELIPSFVGPDDGDDGEVHAPIPRLKPESPGANPTPKVDSDLWSAEDRLGYEAYARTIASLITHKETKSPLTIGIKAPWGAGKTTLMKRVQHLLDGYAGLSEGSRIGILQEVQPPAVTLRELLRELKDSTKPEGLPLIQSKEGRAYGLPARTTVWFNAWKHQTSEQIWAGMAHCIISQITARMKVKDRELFWVRLHARRINVEEVRRKIYWAAVRYLVPVVLVVLVMCAVVFWLAAVLPVGLPIQYVMRGVSILGGLLGLIWRWRARMGEKAAGTMRRLIREPDYEGKMGYLHLVESDIREVLQLATAASVTKENPNGNPLVVFVDDLDRCAPNKVAEVVQAINLFLCGDYPNCIFVLGMEPGMVAAALEVANKDVIQKAEEMVLVDRTAPVGWRFMEKIVQLPIMIPPPTEAGRRKYVNSLTGLLVESGGNVATFALKAEQGAVGMVQISRPHQHGAEEEEKVQSYIRKIGPVKNATEAARQSQDVVKQASDEERWAAQEAGKRVYEQTLSERDPVTSLFVDDVAQLVDGNPRQIKRYVNVFRFYSTLRHSLRLEGVIPSEDLPDKVLAKFVALSIHWPHAVDCMRVMVEGAEGKKVSLLKRLETDSRGLTGDGATADKAWKKVVDELKLPSWAEERAFREFLSGGESLCAKEGHGLW